MSSIRCRAVCRVSSFAQKGQQAGWEHERCGCVELIDYVQGGKMTQEGFAALLSQIGVELTFEAIYFQYKLYPTAEAIEDPLTVCKSSRRCRAASTSRRAQAKEVPEKLKRKAALQADYEHFSQFFRWCFEMGKAISAANLDVAPSAVRTVPLAVARCSWRRPCARGPSCRS